MTVSPIQLKCTVITAHIKFKLWALILLILTCQLCAQLTYRDIIDVDNLDLHLTTTLTQDQLDSGWRPLFPEDTGWVQQGNRFSIESAGAYRSGGGNGYLRTKKEYSRYEIRAQIRFDNNNTGNNSGILYHTLQGLGNGAFGTINLPISIEFQGRIGNMGVILMIPGDHTINNSGLYAKSTGQPGEIYPLDFVWTDRNNNGHGDMGYAINPAYDSASLAVEGWFGGPPGEIGISKSLGNLHSGVGLNNSPYYVHDSWNLMEAKVYGADSAVHIINKVLVSKIWDIRRGNNDPKSAIPYDKGTIAFQAEGAALRFRGLFIKELDSDNCPIYQAWPCCKPGEIIQNNQCVVSVEGTGQSVGNNIADFNIFQQGQILILSNEKYFSGSLTDIQGKKIMNFNNVKEIRNPMVQGGVYLISINSGKMHIRKKILVRE